MIEFFVGLVVVFLLFCIAIEASSITNFIFAVIMNIAFFGGLYLLFRFVGQLVLSVVK